MYGGQGQGQGYGQFNGYGTPPGPVGGPNPQFSGQPFGGGASAWDAAGDEPQAALDSDEEDATVTLTSGFAPAPAPADAPPRKPNPKRRKV